LVGARKCHRSGPCSAEFWQRFIGPTGERREPDAWPDAFGSSALVGFRFTLYAEQPGLAFFFSELEQRSALWRQPLVPAAIALELTELQQQSSGELERWRPLV